MVPSLCSICQYDIYPIESIEILLCGHVFHKLCILDWFRNKSNCPICRLVIPLENKNNCIDFHTYVQLTNDNDNDIHRRNHNFHRRYYKIKCVLICIMICSIIIPIMVVFQHYFNIDYDLNITRD